MFLCGVSMVACNAKISIYAKHNFKGMLHLLCSTTVAEARASLQTKHRSADKYKEKSFSSSMCKSQI